MTYSNAQYVHFGTIIYYSCSFCEPLLYVLRCASILYVNVTVSTSAWEMQAIDIVNTLFHIRLLLHLHSDARS